MCGGEENTSPASSMGKTVKNLLLICTTTDLSMLGTTAGISLVRSHHKLCERGNQRGVPKAGRKQGGCEECWYSEEPRVKRRVTLRHIKTLIFVRAECPRLWELLLSDQHL